MVSRGPNSDVSHGDTFGLVHGVDNLIGHITRIKVHIFWTIRAQPVRVRRTVQNFAHQRAVALAIMARNPRRRCWVYDASNKPRGKYACWFNNSDFYLAMRFNPKGFREEIDRRFCRAVNICLLYTSPSPRDQRGSRMPSSA